MNCGCLLSSCRLRKFYSINDILMQSLSFKEFKCIWMYSIHSIIFVWFCFPCVMAKFNLWLLLIQLTLFCGSRTFTLLFFWALNKSVIHCWPHILPNFRKSLDITTKLRKQFANLFSVKLLLKCKNCKIACVYNFKCWKTEKALNALERLKCFNTL